MRWRWWLWWWKEISSKQLSLDISKFNLLDNLRTEKQKFDLRLQKTSDQPYYNSSVGDDDDDGGADNDDDDGYDGCNVKDNQQVYEW